MKERLTRLLIAELKPREKGYEVYDTEFLGLSLRVEPQGTMTYYLRYRLPSGKRARVKLGPQNTLTPKQARDKALEKASLAAQGSDPREERKAKHLTLGEFVKHQYGPIWLAKRQRAKETTDRLENVFKPLWKVRLNDIGMGQVERLRSKRLHQGRSPATLNKEITLLKSVLNRAVEWGFLKVNPIARMRQMKEDKTAKVRYLFDDEEKRLMEALEAREERIRAERDSANKWRRERGYAELVSLRSLEYVDCLHPIVILSLHTGLRRGEVFNLRWEDVDLELSQLTVRGATAKTGSTRHVQLNSLAREVLAKWRKQTTPSGLVFSNPKTGTRLDNLNTSWENLLEEAKIEDFRWHDMRHHFASKLVMAGVDLNTTRDLLGHRDIKMTLRYAHLAPEIKRNAVERLVKTSGDIIPFPNAATNGDS